jgi:thiol-disulfide isomerase/thioredoxin
MTPGRRDALVVGTVALAAAGAGALVGALALQSRSGAAALLSAVYPDLSGRPRQLAEWRGRVLLCNFWATWCAPCREEMPMLAELREKYVSKGVEFVGIGIDPAAKLAEFARTYRIHYPLLVADAGVASLMRELGNGPGGLPFSVILDRSGSVAYRRLGALSRTEVEGALVGLLR